MIKTSLIVIFALVVKLSTCTKEGSSENTDFDFFNAKASPPTIACIANGLKATAGVIRPLLDAINAAQNDSNKQKNLLKELQEQSYFLVWYKTQAVEFQKSTKVWSTLKTDVDSLMKRFQYTRINVWLQSLEAFFFPLWLHKAKNFNRYEKWLIGCSICQEEKWEIFKQAINDKYGNSTKEGIIALAKAISDLHSEVSLEIIYYDAMSMKVPETDGEIAYLCSVVGELTTMKHLACKLVVKAQSFLVDSLFPNKHKGTNILYGIIRSKDACETFKIITERFTNENSSATTTGVENCIMKVHRFIENTNLITFFATCPSSVTSEELKKKLSPLIQTHVLNLGSDLEIFNQSPPHW